MNVALQNATVPVTVLMAVCMAGIGWWVNAQEAEVKEVQTDVRELEELVTDQRMEVVEDLGAIRTQQALDSLKVEQILETLKAIREEMKAPE